MLFLPQNHETFCNPYSSIQVFSWPKTIKQKRKQWQKYIFFFCNFTFSFRHNLNDLLFGLGLTTSVMVSPFVSARRNVKSKLTKAILPRTKNGNVAWNCNSPLAIHGESAEPSWLVTKNNPTAFDLWEKTILYWSEVKKSLFITFFITIWGLWLLPSLSRHLSIIIIHNNNNQHFIVTKWHSSKALPDRCWEKFCGPNFDWTPTQKSEYFHNNTNNNVDSVN